MANKKSASGRGGKVITDKQKLDLIRKGIKPTTAKKK